MLCICRSLAFLTLLATTCSAVGQISTSMQIGKPDKPVVGLPFTADQSVRTVTHLPNGLTIVREMKGHICRTAEGVERYEGTFPSIDPAHPDPTTMVSIIDRVKRTSILLNATLKTAVRQDLPAVATITVNLLPLQPSPQNRPIKPENLTTVDLGHKTLELLDIYGKLVTGTIPVGKVGNDQPLSITAEVWVAPKMKLIVKQIDKNPLAGDRTFELTNIRVEEPDPALFQIPDGYTVKDRPAMPTTPAQIQALKETSAPAAPEQRTRQIQDALDDPNPVNKNNVAYGLAQNGDHLADAQLLAEQAVQLEEQQVADIVSGGDTAKSFDQMVFLSRTWDTTGYVYYRAHKLDRAEAYLRAAWELNPNSLFAMHLGYALEARQKQKEAATIYRMALSAKPSPAIQDRAATQLTRVGLPNAERLPIDIATPLPGLALPPTSANDQPLVDIVIGNGHPPAVTLLKGNSTLKKPLTDAIRSALASSLPDSGPELVIRRARLTCSAGDTPACSLHFTNTPEFTSAEQARRDALRSPLP